MKNIFKFIFCIISVSILYGCGNGATDSDVTPLPSGKRSFEEARRERDQIDEIKKRNIEERSRMDTQEKMKIFYKRLEQIADSLRDTTNIIDTFFIKSIKNKL